MFPFPLSAIVLIVVTVPETHADLVREAMGNAGGGTVGNYTHCSFSFKGVGRFLPCEGANPAIGTIGKLEAVIEETIQMPCSIELLDQVIAAIKKVHPYEKPGIDLMPLYEYLQKQLLIAAVSFWFSAKHDDYMLSEEGNPTIETLTAIFEAIGFKMQVIPA